MNDLRQLDILVEILELCQHLIAELRHQLLYFKASVYKNEAQALLDEKLGVLGILIEILGDENSSDLWTAFSSKEPLFSAHTPPGECSFSIKLALLLGGLDEALQKFYSQINLKAEALASPEKITESLRLNKRKILTLCSEQDRKYAIIEGI